MTIAVDWDVKHRTKIYQFKQILRAWMSVSDFTILMNLWNIVGV